MTTKTILIILNIAGLICSLIWLYTKFEWEPLVTSIGLLGTLIAQLFKANADKPTKVNMSQKGGKGSTNYQSKGDIKINIKNDKR
jgi:hypothetical protein